MTKDVFVEIDYMEGHYPDPDALQQVKDAFAAQGIQLHIQVDEQALDYWPYTFFPGYDFPYPPYHGFNQVKMVHFGTPDERNAGDWDNENWKQKAQVFHYGLFWKYFFSSNIKLTHQFYNHLNSI